jgi:SWI/SNF-related matrix-associated actin-dependent regulator 1 of chromatin subfamily A
MLRISSQYDPALVSILKRAGCGWNKASRVWQKPLATAGRVIDQLRELNGDDRYVVSGIDDIAAAYHALKNNVISSSSAVDIDDQSLLEKMPAHLFAYQKAGVAFVIKKNGRALIADEQGLGKTAQALVSVKLLNDKRVVVVAPASVLENWRREAKRWIDVDAYIPKKTTEDVTDRDFIIISYDAAKKLKIGQRDCLIIDEAHYIKNTKSQRHKKIIEIADGCKHVITLTGTPLISRPVELWGVMRAVHGKNCMPFFNYAKRFCDAHQTDFGWDFSGSSNLEELNILFRSFAARRVKSQVLSDLPEKINETVYFRDSYKKSDIEKTIEKLLKQYGHDVAAVMKALGEEGIKRLWQDVLVEFHRNADFKAIDDDLIQYVIDSATVKTLVFAKHRNILDSLADALRSENIKFIRIDGNVDVEARQKRVDLFNNNDEIKVALLTFGAAREGLNMQSASQVIFTELDWTPGAMSQAEARAHRIGQKSSVLVKTLITSSFDSMMQDALLSKIAVVSNAVDRIDSGAGSTDLGIMQAIIEAVAKRMTENVDSNINYGAEQNALV